mgnify:CR=1 FL=1
MEPSYDLTVTIDLVNLLVTLMKMSVSYFLAVVISVQKQPATCKNGARFYQSTALSGVLQDALRCANEHTKNL